MSNSLNVFHQPKPFYMIFSLEFWERFGFYGVQAILGLYFVRKLGYSEAQADIVFGAFSALVMGLVAFGGKIGDSYLGTKRTMLLGAFTLATGYFLLGLAAEAHELLFVGLGAVIAGNGLFKANPSSLLARCYKEGDPRLDGAFTMYYMAVNLGSMFSMFLVPILSHKYNWSIGFYTCTFGLILCIFSYTLLKSSVRHIGSKPDNEPLRFHRLLLCIFGTIVVSLVSALLLQHVTIAHWILYAVGVFVLFLYLIETFRLKGLDRTKMWVSLILILEAVIFFTLYYQMPTSLNFFAVHNVHHDLLGISVPPESFQSLNAIWIVIASPVLAIAYNHLGSRGKDFSMPMKFAFGMVLCSISFLVLPLAAQTADTKGIISSNWMIITYGFQSVGELLISGLGLAMIAQLVPRRLNGFLMGAWWLSAAFAAVLAGFVASLTAPPENVTDPVKTLPIYSHVFLQIGIYTAVIAVIMLITAPVLGRIIGHKKAP